MTFKRARTIFLVVALLALDWAALHDILKGESNPVLEWTMLAVSAAVFISIAREEWRRRKATTTA